MPDGEVVGVAAVFDPTDEQWRAWAADPCTRKLVEAMLEDAAGKRELEAKDRARAMEAFWVHDDESAARARRNADDMRTMRGVTETWVSMIRQRVEAAGGKLDV